MSSFRFEASDSAGRIEKGLVEADSAAAARSALRARGLIPLAVDDIGARPATASGTLRRRRFSEAELVLVTRQLASFLSAGLPVAQALSATIDQAEDPAVRERLKRRGFVGRALERGTGLFDVARQLPEQRRIAAYTKKPRGGSPTLRRLQDGIVEGDLGNHLVTCISERKPARST